MQFLMHSLLNDIESVLKITAVAIINQIDYFYILIAILYDLDTA
jgi:hypothetical protein